MSSTPSRAGTAPAHDEVICAQIAPSRHVPDLVEDVRAGLLAAPRSLPPKYFYDARGSELFDRICDRPEYYLTRAEMALLDSHAADVVDAVRPERILELGSGAPRKVRFLLDACDSQGLRPTYSPFDVCEDVLVDSARSLASGYPWLQVDALLGDYSAGLDNLPQGAGPSLYMFLGSTIGNFPPEAATAFLAELHAVMARKDRLLLGADRVKDPKLLHAAYNDGAGLTAAFNLNLLHVLNRELEADFDPGAFRHYACFSPACSRMEMYLIAAREQQVHIGSLGERLHFHEGEHILTEVSCKFTRTRLQAMLAEAGFAIERHFEPGDGGFSLVLARAA